MSTSSISNLSFSPLQFLLSTQHCPYACLQGSPPAVRQHIWSSSLDDTASSSLNRHRTPSSSSVGVTTWNLTCPHRYASLPCHYAGLEQAVILLRVHGCISPVTSREEHFLTADILRVWFQSLHCLVPSMISPKS